MLRLRKTIGVTSHIYVEWTEGNPSFFCFFGLGGVVSACIAAPLAGYSTAMVEVA